MNSRLLTQPEHWCVVLISSTFRELWKWDILNNNDLLDFIKIHKNTQTLLNIISLRGSKFHINFCRIETSYWTISSSFLVTDVPLRRPTDLWGFPPQKAEGNPGEEKSASSNLLPQTVGILIQTITAFPPSNPCFTFIARGFKPFRGNARKTVWRLTQGHFA